MKHIAMTQVLLLLGLVPGSGFAQMDQGQAARSAPSSLQILRAQPILSLAGEQVPPVAPQVICADGLVTLNAQNTTLASILRAVASCTSAVVDMPPDVGTTRVAARLGPAQPTAIIAALLDGSLNYIILKSSRNPEQVRMVMVWPRQANTTGIGQESAATRTAPQTAVSQAVTATFIDENGVERLPSGLTQEEALLPPEELAKRFEASREQQRRIEGLPPLPDPPQQ